jgi:hypothetical protein
LLSSNVPHRDCTPIVEAGLIVPCARPALSRSRIHSRRAELDRKSCGWPEPAPTADAALPIVLITTRDLQRSPFAQDGAADAFAAVR